MPLEGRKNRKERKLIKSNVNNIKNANEKERKRENKPIIIQIKNKKVRKLIDPPRKETKTSKMQAK